MGNRKNDLLASMILLVVALVFCCLTFLNSCRRVAFYVEVDSGDRLLVNGIRVFDGYKLQHLFPDSATLRNAEYTVRVYPKTEVGQLEKIHFVFSVFGVNRYLLLADNDDLLEMSFVGGEFHDATPKNAMDNGQERHPRELRMKCEKGDLFDGVKTKVQSSLKSGYDAVVVTLPNCLPKIRLKRIGPVL